MAKVQTIINNEERVHTFQLPGKTSKNGSVNIGPTIRLVSGVNFVPVTRWEIAKKNPMVLTLLEEVIPRSPSAQSPSGGNPERVGRPKIQVGAVVDDEHPLAELSVTAAVDMVRETLDLNTLKLWTKDEGRSDVRKAIAAQMAEIEPPKGEVVAPKTLSKAQKIAQQQVSTPAKQ